MLHRLLVVGVTSQVSVFKLVKPSLGVVQEVALSGFTNTIIGTETLDAQSKISRL